VEDLIHMERWVKDVYFPYPIIVAGGVFKTAESMRWALAHDIIGEWGSIETEASSGNGGRDYSAEYQYVGDVGVLISTQNSLGIPNPGMDHVEQHAGELKRRYADKNFPLIINVSGKSADDTLSLIKRAIECGFRVIIVNGACPNKGNQAMLCYDPEGIDEVFYRAEVEIGDTGAVILWKVSTGMPRGVLAYNRDKVITSSVFTGIVTGNTVPSTLDYNARGETTILTEKNRLTRGGMAGPAIRQIALDHTEFCAQEMPLGKIVYGCGGVVDGNSFMKFHHAGATLVGLHSAFRESGEDPDFMRELYRKVDKRLRPRVVSLR
jgi:dihydroorotate dehydrogenase